VALSAFLLLNTHVQSQHWLTYGEVYDYEIGDLIVTKGYMSSSNGGWHEYYNDQIEMEVIDKQWSAGGDTVFYYFDRKRRWRQLIHDITWEVHIIHDTIMHSRKSLDAVIVENWGGSNLWLEKFIEPNRFHGRVQNSITDADGFDATVHEFAEGLGRSRSIATSYSWHSQDEIKYYRKGNEEWGSYTPIPLGEQNLKETTALGAQNPATNYTHMGIEDGNADTDVIGQPNVKQIVSEQSDLSCLPDGIELTTQDQIDNFQTNYPGSTEIEGSVSISGNNITNLNGLNVLTSIGGSLSITLTSALNSLHGLENLTTVGGNLTFYGNTSLTSLAGIKNLTSILGNLRIYFNDSLTNLNWLEGLTSIGGNFWIDHNSALTNLSGLDSLTSVGGYLWINANPALTSLSGLENLDSIGGNFRLFSNNALTDLSGLDGLVSIGAYLWIKGNDALTSMNGLGNLNNVGDYFWIFDNDALTDMSGLDSLSAIGGNLWFMKNDSLTSLNGMDNLSSIGGDLWINFNENLTSLAGFENLEPASIMGLRVINNSTLSNCDAEWLCDYLGAPNGTVEIYGNASGCSFEEIAIGCGGLPCQYYGPFLFYDQYAIDLFPLMFSNCTSIQSSVVISGDDITDLGGLNTVTSIGQDLTVSANTSLTSLNGLHSLHAVGQDFQLNDNDALTNLSGLDNLANIGGNLLITDNSALIGLNGLDSLTAIEGDFKINLNHALASLSGLNNLTSVGGDLEIGGPVWKVLFLLEVIFILAVIIPSAV